jgi:integral membrane protein 2B
LNFRSRNEDATNRDKMKEYIGKNFFEEEIVVKDDESDSFADIKILYFQYGRSGRFIHDYMNNQTTIVDEFAKRCFVYPLDYETTLPPKSMVDALVKMLSGYYIPDASELIKKMRAVIPELDHDDDFISDITASVCVNKKIYRLEPSVSGVFKRSTKLNVNDQSVWTFNAGKGTVTVELANADELESYESKASH